jgi:hypothetical protein
MKRLIDMRYRIILGLVVMSSILAVAIPEIKANTAIDFEHLPGPDGILGTADDVPTPNCPGSICGPPLTNEFSSIGITFSGGTLFQGGLFPGSSPNNHYISSTPLDVTLSVPVFGISIISYSYWTAVLTAFDELNNVIGTAVLTNPNEGVTPLLGTLSVSTNLPIHRFTAVAQSGPDHILNLDNLTLNTANPVTVPTLTEWGMIVSTVLLGIASIYHLRRQGVAG